MSVGTNPKAAAALWESMHVLFQTSDHRNNGNLQLEDLVEENKELRRELAELYAQLAEDGPGSESKQDPESTLVGRLHANLVTLQAALKFETEAKLTLEEQLQRLQKAYSDAAAVSEMKGSIVSGMNEKLKFSEKRILDLSAELVQLLPLRAKELEHTTNTSRLLAELSRCQQSLTTSLSKNTTLQSKCQSLAAECKSRDDTIKELTERCQTFEESNAAITEQLKQSTSQGKSQSQLIEELQAHLKRRELRELEIISDCNHWERKCESLKKEISRANDDTVESMRKTMTALREENGRLLAQRLPPPSLEETTCKTVDESSNMTPIQTATVNASGILADHLVPIEGEDAVSCETTGPDTTSCVSLQSILVVLQGFKRS